VQAEALLGKDGLIAIMSLTDRIMDSAKNAGLQCEQAGVSRAQTASNHANLIARQSRKGEHP
jgi:hypothetical protein